MKGCFTVSSSGSPNWTEDGRLSKFRVELYSKKYDIKKGFRDYRKLVVSNFLIRIFKMVGFSIDEIWHTTECLRDNCCLFVVYDGYTERYRVDIEVGDVKLLNSGGGTITRSGETENTTMDDLTEFFAIIFEECKQINDCYNFDSSLTPLSLNSMVHGLVNFQILCFPHNSILNLDSRRGLENDARQLFYNYNRISAILLTYDLLVQTDKYPPLPKIDDSWYMHFSDIEESILKFLKDWGNVVASIVNIVTGVVDTTKFVEYIQKFNKLCNHYYHAFNVLTPPEATHLFYKIHMRIHIYKVLQNFILEIFDLFRV